MTNKNLSKNLFVAKRIWEIQPCPNGRLRVRRGQLLLWNTAALLAMAMMVTLISNSALFLFLLSEVQGTFFVSPYWVIWSQNDYYSIHVKHRKYILWILVGGNSNDLFYPLLSSWISTSTFSSWFSCLVPLVGVQVDAGWSLWWKLLGREMAGKHSCILLSMIQGTDQDHQSIVLPFYLLYLQKRFVWSWLLQV